MYLKELGLLEVIFKLTNYLLKISKKAIKDLNRKKEF
jgi:hypothetical protein